MAIINSRENKDEQTAKESARTAIETYHAKPDLQIGPTPDPITRRRHLDVDAVLERSLRSVGGGEL